MCVVENLSDNDVLGVSKNVTEACYTTLYTLIASTVAGYLLTIFALFDALPRLFILVAFPLYAIPVLFSERVGIMFIDGANDYYVAECPVAVRLPLITPRRLCDLASAAVNVAKKGPAAATLNGTRIIIAHSSYRGVLLVAGRMTLLLPCGIHSEQGAIVVVEGNVTRTTDILYCATLQIV